MAVDELVAHGVAHAAALARLDLAVDGPVALRCGRAHRLRKHAATEERRGRWAPWISHHAAGAIFLGGCTGALRLHPFARPVPFMFCV